MLNQNDIPWRETKSPGGKYHLFQKDISLALGGIKDKGLEAGGHPFDLALVKLPPLATNWPRHAHSSQWELFMVISGEGVLITSGEQQELTAGDCVMMPPGEVHQIKNISPEEDLLFYVIANNPTADIITYPDSQKWFIKPHRKVFQMAEVEYYQGEE